MKKDLKKFKIVIPTLYEGSSEPTEPKEGDVWQNCCAGNVYVFLGNKWFQIINFKSTGYTKQEQEELEDKNELKKFRKVVKELKELLQ